MASTASAIAGAVLDNASAEKIVFSNKKLEVLSSGFAIGCNNVQCLYEFWVFRYKIQEEDPLAIIPEEQLNNDEIKVNKGDMSSSNRNDVVSHRSVPPITMKEESVNDLVYSIIYAFWDCFLFNALSVVW